MVIVIRIKETENNYHEIERIFSEMDFLELDYECGEKYQRTRMDKIHQLAEKMNEVEEQLHNLIQELPEFGEPCDCADRDCLNFIYYGDWMEIQTYCLSCGGFVEELE